MASDPEADRLLRQGAELSAASPADAKEPIERAVELAPDDPEILVRAAALSFYNGAYERSWELLVRARERADADSELTPTIAYVGGRILLLTGREADALELLAAAFDARPQEHRYGYVLAVALLAAGRLDEARSVATRALHSGANDDDLPRLGDHLAAAPVDDQDLSTVEGMLATAAVLATFDPDRTVKLYEEALRSGDEVQRARAAFGLGALLVEDDPVQARGMFERAAQSADPQLAELAREQLAALG
jgi:tetratricopeptide (TPR) repeat protein